MDYQVYITNPCLYLEGTPAGGIYDIGSVRDEVGFIEAIEDKYGPSYNLVYTLPFTVSSDTPLTEAFDLVTAFEKLRKQCNLETASAIVEELGDIWRAFDIFLGPTGSNLRDIGHKIFHSQHHGLSGEPFIHYMDNAAWDRYIYGAGFYLIDVGVNGYVTFRVN